MNFSLEIAESSEILLMKKKCSILPIVCCGWYIPQRYILATFLFMGLSTHYIIMKSGSVVFHHNQIKSPLDEKPNNQCSPDGKSNLYQFHDRKDISKMDNQFTNEEISHLENIFVIAYSVSQVPSIILAQKYGGKLMFLLSVICVATLHILIPIIAKMNIPMLIIVMRALEGAALAPLYNIALQLLVRWCPAHEMGTLVSIAFSGLPFGDAVGHFFSILINEYYLVWTACFYYFGALSYIWVIGFCIMCYTEPSEHPYINSKELKLIQSSYEGYASISQKIKGGHYFKIIKSGYVWLIALMYSVQLSQYKILLTVMEQYMIRQEKMHTFTAAVLRTVAGFSMTIGGILFGIIIDSLQNRKLTSKRNTRRYGFLISLSVPFILLLPCVLVECNLNNCIVWIILSSFWSGSMVLLKIHIVDIAPNSAGTTFAMIHTMGILLYLVLSFVTHDEAGLASEHRSMHIMVGTSILLALFLSCFILKYCTVNQMEFDKIEMKVRRVRHFPARY